MPVEELLAGALGGGLVSVVGAILVAEGVKTFGERHLAKYKTELKKDSDTFKDTLDTLAAKTLENHKDALRKDFEPKMEAFKSSLQERTTKAIDDHKEALRREFEPQLESLRSRLRREESEHVLMHRLQFEEEFKVYLQLWSALIAVKRAALAPRNELRTLLAMQDAMAKASISSPNEPVTDVRRFTPDDAKVARAAVESAVKVFNDLYEMHRPFIADEVHQACDALKMVALKETLELLFPTAGTAGVAFLVEAPKLLEQRADEVSNAIRSRIRRINVVEAVTVG